MDDQKQDITRRTITMSTIDSLIKVIHKLATDDTVYREFMESPYNFFKKFKELNKLSDYYSEETDFIEITDMVQKIRKAIQTDSLDIGFLFNFSEVKGLSSNYQSWLATEYNFDKSESSEVNFAREGNSIRSTKPGWKSVIDRRLHAGITSGYEGKSSDEVSLVLGGQDFGPLLNPKLLKFLSKEIN